MTTRSPARTAGVPARLDRPTDGRSRRWRWLWPSLVVIILGFGAAAVVLGERILSPGELVDALFGPTPAPMLTELAANVRVPRMLLAVIAGVALGIAGALLQALTRNPLASPELTGVTAGAVAAVLAFLAFGPPLPVFAVDVIRPFVAVAGGAFAAGVTYLLTRTAGGVESNRMILMGVLVGGVLTSLSTLSLLFLGPRVEGIIDWITGTLAGRTWHELLLTILYVTPAFVLLPSAIARANALQLGDAVAISLGQRRERDRLLVLAVAIVLTCGVVSIVGAISFVGLMAPHLVRPLVGSDLRRLAPASGLAGAAMVLVADLFARFFDVRVLLGPLGDEVFSGVLPVGVYLTLFGVPFLLSLLRRRPGG